MVFSSAKDSLALLEQGLKEAWNRCDRASTTWVAASCPAPAAAGTSLVNLTSSTNRVYWASNASEGSSLSPARSSEEFFGIGAACLVQVTGDDRFERAREQIEESYRHLFSDDELRPLLRFFGGTSFAPVGSEAEPSWKAFGDARFLLPRVLYQSTEEGARLLCVAEEDRLTETLELASAVLDAAEQSPPPESTALNALERHDSAPPSAWHSLIESIQTSIKDGDLEKVVAARRLKIRVSQSPRLSTVIERLGQIAPRCARFALTVGQQTFVGATPERLVKREGRAVLTEALAGSIDARAEEAGQKLLSSEKDRHEHGYVVEAIEKTLSPLCDKLQISPEPEVRSLKHILHLRTPISGTLKNDVHILSLADRLHPTPAVGGLPQGKAVSWIQKHEQAERGWYAAPIGWLNASGDGEFFVALRSALISEKNIHIYAGAGIVADSDPNAEYAETELKLSGMLSALGLSPLGVAS